MVDEERARLPLPARWHSLHVRLMLVGMPYGHLDHVAALSQGIYELRDHVRWGLRQVARYMGWAPGEAPHALPQIGMALERCLEDADDITCAFDATEPESEPEGGAWRMPKPQTRQLNTLTGLWRSMLNEHGRRDALSWMWQELINPLDHPELILALTVEFWYAAGEALGLDAALLSRGWPSPATAKLPESAAERI
jgi:hypothetical protein